MLVLSRQNRERIIIDGRIAITVGTLAKTAFRVRIGVHAPRDIRVDREEIWSERDGDGTPFQVPHGNTRFVARIKEDEGFSIELIDGRVIECMAVEVHKCHNGRSRRTIQPATILVEAPANNRITLRSAEKVRAWAYPAGVTK